MQKINHDGIVEEECVTRLPKSATLERSHATLLSTLPSAQKVGLVFNKSLQSTYSCSEKDDIRLPILVARNRDTIETNRYKHHLTIEDRNSTKKRRKWN